MQCDRCEEWFHLLCIGLGEDEISEHEDYVCYKCKAGITKAHKKAKTQRQKAMPPILHDPMAPLMMAIKEDLEASSGISSCDENVPPFNTTTNSMMPPPPLHTERSATKMASQEQKSVNVVQPSTEDDDNVMVTDCEVAPPRHETVVVESSHPVNDSVPGKSGHGIQLSPVEGIEIGEDASTMLGTDGDMEQGENVLTAKHADNVSEVTNTMQTSDPASST